MKQTTQNEETGTIKALHETRHLAIRISLHLGLQTKKKVETRKNIQLVVAKVNFLNSFCTKVSEGLKISIQTSAAASEGQKKKKISKALRGNKSFSFC